MIYSGHSPNTCSEQMARQLLHIIDACVSVCISGKMLIIRSEWFSGLPVKAAWKVVVNHRRLLYSFCIADNNVSAGAIKIKYCFLGEDQGWRQGRGDSAYISLKSHARHQQWLPIFQDKKRLKWIFKSQKWHCTLKYTCEKPYTRNTTWKVEGRGKITRGQLNSRTGKYHFLLTLIVRNPFQCRGKVQVVAVTF